MLKISVMEPDAYIINSEEIVSADRILEEFQWRKTKWGDMTRSHGEQTSGQQIGI